MLIATFNVNSIKARLPRVLEWLDERKPDVVALQEIKCLDENFPHLEFEDRGYKVETHGQKTYNGVALLSRHEMTDVERGLSGNTDDDQARYIEATIKGVRVCGLYLPNGNPAPGEKFDYKLRWMDHLINRTKKLLHDEIPFLMIGDFNVCPEDIDVYDPEGWQDDALCRPESRSKLRTLMYLGLTDALRQITPEGHAYTFWDYQRGAWQKDHGLRIDHLLLSPQIADRLEDCRVDRAVRGEEKASDHVPVWVRIHS